MGTMTTEFSSRKQKLLTTFMVLCVVAILVVGVETTKKPLTSATSKPASHSHVATSAPTTMPNTYTNGTYIATGSYSSPGGTQSLMVNLTLSGNKITDAMVTPSAQDGVAQVYQSYFVQNFKNYVIGKNINDVKLSRVAGSSLTSQGFNNALLQIKKKAEA